MIDIGESDTGDKKCVSPTINSLKKNGGLEEFRVRQDFKSRLAEYLTGYPIEDGEVLLNQIIADKENYHEELDFPPVEERIDNPTLYRSKIIDRAGREGIKIISFRDVPDWLLEKDPWIKNTMEEGSPTAGCYSEELNCIIIGDPTSEDPKVLKVVAHELVHAIDYKRMKQEGVQTLSIERLEYRAYLLADLSRRRLESENGIKVLPGLFGDFAIGGSSFGYYLDKSLEAGKCDDFSDFMKKAKEGVIHIPWYSSRPSKI